MFDGGPQWHFWARVALRACTKMWGGEGFVLVPHHEGKVHPQLIHAVRTYDPDYVVTVERTVRTVELATPGALNFHDGGKALTGEARAEAVTLAGDQPVSNSADETARLAVAEACSPHRRRHVDLAESGWDYPITQLPTDGAVSGLTLLTAITDETPAVLLSPPSTWGGPLGVMASARCGVVEEPIPSVDPELQRGELVRLTRWLLDPHHAIRSMPFDLFWQAGMTMSIDPNSVVTAFAPTSRGVGWIARGFRARGRMLISAGDDADDFAIALIHQRLYGAGIWLPLTWWTADEPTKDVVRSVLSSAVFHHIHRSGEVIVSSTSVEAPVIEEILAALRTPIAWAEDDYDRAVERLTEHVTVDSGSWPRRAIRYLAVDGQFDQDFAIPIVRNDVDDIEMVVACPLLALTQPDLADCDELRWQVDVEFVEAVTPPGRGLDGHTLYANASDAYLTWIRSGRDTVTYESERYDFIAAGTPKSGTLARPRLRAPSLLTWSKLMAEQEGKQIRLSGAGRTVEVLRRLWGDRASLAADFSGPLLPVFRAFTPTDRKNKRAFDESDGVVLATGAGEQHLYEAYLTFNGMRNLTASGNTDAVELRTLLDGLLQKGVLRRGLILNCAQCGRPAFRSIDEVRQVNQCPRCGAANGLVHERWRKPTEEPYWFYDLHPSVREHLAQNGDVPLQLSQHLRARSRHHVDIAEVELLNTAGSPVAEADLIALADGDLITAEAKRPGTLGAGRELGRCVAKRTTFAEVVWADQIIIATAAPGFDNASIQALCKQVREKPWRAVRPRLRVIAALGTDNVADQEADPLTGGLAEWPKRA